MPIPIDILGIPCLPRGIVSQGTLPPVPMLVGTIVSSRSKYYYRLCVFWVMLTQTVTTTLRVIIRAIYLINKS